MNKMKVVITDYYYETLDMEMKEFAKLENVEICSEYQCKDEDALTEIVKDADVVIVQFAPISRKVIAAMEKCKLIVRYAIGVDNIDITAATDKGIYVANVPDYCTDEVSNHAIAMIFAMSKKLLQLHESVKNGQWNYTVSKPLYRFEGKTLGLIGFGRIPTMIARKMSLFGLKIIAYDKYFNKEIGDSLGVKEVSLDELLEMSDYISVHCPLNEETHHLLNAAAFKKMKNTAFLVNTARGAIVCESDLITALQEGEIAGVGLDVLENEPILSDNPLLHMEQVLITPHNAWYSEEAVLSLQQKVAQEAVRVLQGGVPKNLINKELLK